MLKPEQAYIFSSRFSSNWLVQIGLTKKVHWESATALTN